MLADAGYWHQRQIETVVADGIQVLVSPDSSLRRGARPGWTGGLYDFMRRVLSSQGGRALYRQRQATIEPVFGQLKFNRQIRRFQRRGRAACRSEWRLIAATHNLLKYSGDAHRRYPPATEYPGLVGLVEPPLVRSDSAPPKLGRRPSPVRYPCPR